MSNSPDFHSIPQASISSTQTIDQLAVALIEMANEQKVTNQRLAELTTIVRNISALQNQAVEESESTANFFVQMGTVLSWTLAALPTVILLLIVLFILWAVFGRSLSMWL